MEGCFKIVAEISIYHDFFTNRNCPDIQLMPTGETRWIFYRLQLIFKQTANNCWLILSSDETDCSIPWEETLDFRIKITNPDFWHYTAFLAKGSDGLQLENIRITLSEASVLKGLKGVPIRKSISFSSPETYWKYIFIPNVENARVKKIKFIDQSSHPLPFNQVNEIAIGEKTGHVFISTEPIQLKESYEYRFELFEEKQHGEKLLRREIAFPEIHAYDPETRRDKIKTLSQYIYY